MSSPSAWTCNRCVSVSTRSLPSSLFCLHCLGCLDGALERKDSVEGREEMWRLQFLTWRLASIGTEGKVLPQKPS